MMKIRIEQTSKSMAFLLRVLLVCSLIMIELNFTMKRIVFVKTDMLPILKGGFIMVNVSNLPVGLAEELAFSEDEIEELKIAREKPIVFDEDCPETTPERAMKFRRVNPPRENRTKRA